MSLFRKNKQLTPSIKKQIFDCGADIRKDKWFDVFSASLGKIMANQTACLEYVVKGQDWNIDLDAGIISFGKDNYPLQFIGSESTSSNSWLWGWENINHFPDKVIELAQKTKATGEAWGLEPLTTAKFELSDVFNGHRVSIVTCAINDKNLCYYRCPHSNGAIFVAFSDIPDIVFRPLDIHNFISRAMECVQGFRVDHKIFIQSFLYQNDTPFEWDKLSIIAHFKQNLRIDFEQVDEFLRISKMKTLNT